MALSYPAMGNGDYKALQVFRLFIRTANWHLSAFIFMKHSPMANDVTFMSFLGTTSAYCRFRLILLQAQHVVRKLARISFVLAEKELLSDADRVLDSEHIIALSCITLLECTLTLLL